LVEYHQQSNQQETGEVPVGFFLNNGVYELFLVLLDHLSIFLIKKTLIFKN